MTRKEKHIKLWDSIIKFLAFLGDRTKDIHEFANFDDLHYYVWSKTFNEDWPLNTCYACEESIMRYGSEDRKRCKVCPIAEACGICLESSDSAYDRVYELFSEFIDSNDIDKIDDIIKYCKQIRDGWR